MWATASLPLGASRPPIFARSLTNRVNPNSLKLRASFSDYPLASKIMVRNLPFSTSESRLKEEFSTFGQVAEVKVARDEATKRSKGYAFIQYTSQDDAMLAIEEMDSKNFEGRVIHVDLAKPVKNVGRSPITSGPPMDNNPPKQDMEED
ncbi:glycine-rich RNA-binding protein 4, mitochondrial isoform X1 [Malania oleifera]|uniref:glycine-rich RNA-binding protein 4, mitochondrial isoform X1 n=1 Tax=Malania oleifera TaxID=397392 RepID=UPI0025AEB2A1|nr:glycine-rich RNA-binding protein 4, mitochondrial isoform X1 [Malania oleifera]